MIRLIEQGSPLFIDWHPGSICPESITHSAEFLVTRIRNERLLKVKSVMEIVYNPKIIHMLKESRAAFVLIQSDICDCLQASSDGTQGKILQTTYRGLFLEVVRRSLCVKHLFTASSDWAKEKIPPTDDADDYSFRCLVSYEDDKKDLKLKFLFRWAPISVKTTKKLEIIDVAEHGLIIQSMGSGESLEFKVQPIL